MATVSQKQKQQFIGRAWKNVAGAGTPNAGVEFLSFRVDRGIEVTLTDKDNIMLWPNAKREGKQDADFRVSVAVAEAVA